MQSTEKNRGIRFILIVLLSALFLFELHTAYSSDVSADYMLHHSGAVLRSASADQLFPVRIPEKVTYHEEASQSWERWNKRESEQIAFLQIFCIVLCFLLFSRAVVSNTIPKSSNLPHIRIMHFIHQKDGKGPGDLLSFRHFN